MYVQETAMKNTFKALNHVQLMKLWKFKLLRMVYIMFINFLAYTCSSTHTCMQDDSSAHKDNWPCRSYKQ